MKRNCYYCLSISIVGLLWCFTGLAHADQAVRHYATKPYTEQHNRHQHYYHKAPRIIHRPLSSHKHHRHENQWRQIPRHYRGDSRHQHHIRRSRHKHPSWHYESFVLGLGLSIILND